MGREQSYDGTGIGRGWTLLTAERGHYELAAGRSADLQIEAMERFANDGVMIPEQVWDADDLPGRGLRNGKGTGSATPRVWAHAEYLNAASLEARPPRVRTRRASP